MANESAGFDSCLRGSWWDVQIIRQRSGMFLISFNAAKEEDLSWVPISDLRISSRKADGWDCYLLKKGMDVGVLSIHPHSEALGLQQEVQSLPNAFQFCREALYDAQVSSVDRSKHLPGMCSCKFGVQFYTVRVDSYLDGGTMQRSLLTDLPETEVSISIMRILQQPSGTIPLDAVLEAHMYGLSVPVGRSCKDAYFLAETDLGNTKKPLRTSVPGDTAPTQVRSHEVLSASAARLSAKNGDKGSNCGERKKDMLGTVGEDLVTPKTTPKTTLDAVKPKPKGPKKAGQESPLSINNKRKSEPTQDRIRVGSQGLIDEAKPKRKPGRPRKDAQKKPSESDWKPYSQSVHRVMQRTSAMCTRNATKSHKPRSGVAQRGETKEESPTLQGHKLDSSVRGQLTSSGCHIHEPGNISGMASFSKSKYVKMKSAEDYH